MGYVVKQIPRTTQKSILQGVNINSSYFWAYFGPSRGLQWWQKGALRVHMDLLPKVHNIYRLCSPTNTQINPKKHLRRCEYQFGLSLGMIWALLRLPEVLERCFMGTSVPVLLQRLKMDRRQRQRRRIFGSRKQTEDKDEDSQEFLKIFEDLQRQEFL